MLQIGFVLKAFVAPSLALVIPIAILIYHISSNNLKVALSRRQIIKFGIAWFLISLTIFGLLSYMTGDLGLFFYLVPGFYPFIDGVQINLSENLGFTFRYDPGISLGVVSMLSAVLYSSLLTLPSNCTYSSLKKDDADKKSSGGAASSASSGISATASAVASTAVCCSTSMVAVIAPAAISLLGPFVPFMLILSMALLIFSFYRVVLPRFPVV